MNNVQYFIEAVSVTSEYPQDSVAKNLESQITANFIRGRGK